MNTSIVILNYNGRELLRQFLPFVIQFSSQAKIVLADNHSTDGSGEAVRREFPSVEVIDIPQNLGFCGGYNYALKQVKTEFYILLNSDVEVTEGWLDPMIKLLQSDSTIAAAQPKILSWRDRSKFEYAGAGGGYIDSLGYPFCRGRIFQSIEEDEGQYDDTRPVFWATGACLAIRSSVFHDMGGFDEDFFAHMEEIDLCWRLHRNGYQVYYVGRSHVYHVGGATLAKSNPDKTYFNFRNGLRLIFKNLSAGQLVWKLPVRMVLDWWAAFSFLVEGRGGDSVAVARAHLSFIAGIGRDYRKRTAPFGVNGTTLIYGRSLVWDYFLRGRKSFRQLLFRNP